MTPDQTAARLDAIRVRLAADRTTPLGEILALQYAALAFRGAAEAPAALAAMRIGSALALEQIAGALECGEPVDAARLRIAAAAMREKATRGIEASVVAALTTQSAAL